jgi:gas vesicle protein
MRNRLPYLIVGIFCGATVGVLLAPRSGGATRKMIHSAYDRTREARQIARDAADLSRRTSALGRPLGAGEL